MPRFAANLHYLFNEIPFLERFAAAAHAGFQGVEFQVPYQWPAAQLSSLLRENRLELALIDTPQGDWDAGERGLAALPGREDEFSCRRSARCGLCAHDALRSGPSYCRRRAA
jgi:hydroxypyruvate isomerase